MSKVVKLRYRYRIYPTKVQQHQLGQLFGCCRKVYNHFLADRKEAYEKYKATGDASNLKSLHSFAMEKELTQLKQLAEFDYLRQPAAIALKCSLQHLARAFANFFRTKKGYPKFKSRFDNQQSASFDNQRCYLKDGKLHVANFADEIKIKLDRPLPDMFTDSTIVKMPSGKYFVSFIVEVPEVSYGGQGSVGIDLGLKDLATFSNDSAITNPKTFKKFEDKIARLSRQLARKKFTTDAQGRKVPSKNRIKARIKLARAHERLVNIRRDFIEKLTTSILQKWRVVGIEGLKIANMVKNHKLARSISNAGWGLFRRRLVEKERGSTDSFVHVSSSRFPSSKLCHACGHVKISLSLSERSWTCSSCQTHHDRDVNAAKNLQVQAEMAYMRRQLAVMPIPRLSS